MLNFRKYPGECGFSANATVATAANKTATSIAAGGMATQTANSGDEFMIQVRATAKAEGCDIITAMKLVDKKNPQLRMDYIEAGIKKRDEAVAAARIAAIEKAAKVDFMSEAKKLSQSEKITVTAAMQRIAREKPELHAAFIEGCKAKAQLRHLPRYPRV